MAPGTQLTLSATVDFCIHLLSEPNARIVAVLPIRRKAFDLLEYVRECMMKLHPTFIEGATTKERFELINGPDDKRVLVSVPRRDIDVRGMIDDKTHVVVWSRNGFEYFKPPTSADIVLSSYQITPS